jgi:5-formyltetrahydrofolate cyclo-ligase
MTDRQLQAMQQQLQKQLQQLQQQQQQQQIAGNVKVYTGPKQGKFIINKHGKKVYIDRKTLNNNVPYMKKNAKKGKK